MEFWTVDSFTNQAFKGNPAGVCIVEQFPTDALMQQIAREINLSETTFVVRNSDSTYHIRWFTPTTEVQLCGHATLAAAHVLWYELKVSTAQIQMQSLSGTLRATRDGHEITLDFPAYKNTRIPIVDNIVNAIGIVPVAVHKAHDDWIIELPYFADVVNLKPNITLLNQIDCRGIIVTAADGKDDHYDFASRFFAPREGINEDPVTGSAHCKLAPYWSERLHKKEMLAYQASQRGGVIKVRLDNDRVHLTGEAVTMIHGDLRFPPEVE